MEDMLERLRLDPGSRTLGQLLQERQWAMQEISRLRAELGKIGSAPSRAKGIVLERQSNVRPADLASGQNPLRLIRAKDIRQMLGLSNSTIRRMTNEGRLPRPVRLGKRTTAWRLADIIAWQEQLVR
jgi:prophage regulatory protein